MKNILFRPVSSIGSKNFDSIQWIMYEEEKFNEPIIILTSYQVEGLVQQFSNLKKRFKQEENELRKKYKKLPNKR